MASAKDSNNTFIKEKLRNVVQVLCDLVVESLTENPENATEQDINSSNNAVISTDTVRIAENVDPGRANRDVLSSPDSEKNVKMTVEEIKAGVRRLKKKELRRIVESLVTEGIIPMPQPNSTKKKYSESKKGSQLHLDKIKHRTPDEADNSANASFNDVEIASRNCVGILKNGMPDEPDISTGETVNNTINGQSTSLENINIFDENSSETALKLNEGNVSLFDKTEVTTRFALSIPGEASNRSSVASEDLPFSPEEYFGDGFHSDTLVVDEARKIDKFIASLRQAEELNQQQTTDDNISPGESASLEHELLQKFDCPRLVDVAQCETKPLWRHIPKVKDSCILAFLKQSALKRQETKFELLYSEATFYFHLSTAKTHYIDNIMKHVEQNYISLPGIQDLFVDFLSVKDCSEKLLKVFEESWQMDQLMTDIPLVISQFCANGGFSAYITYFSNYSKMMSKFNEYLQNSESLSYLMSCLEKRPGSLNLSLETFLTTPMSRITKLPLLLKAILSTLQAQTDTEEHSQYSQALSDIDKIAQECNSTIDVESLNNISGVGRKVSRISDEKIELPNKKTNKFKKKQEKRKRYAVPDTKFYYPDPNDLKK